MSLSNWLFGFAWAFSFALNVGAAFDITYGCAAFSLLAFALTLGDAMLKARGTQP